MAASTGVTSAQFLAFWLFGVLCLPLLWIRPHKLTRLLIVSAAISTILMIILLIWALATRGNRGLGSIFSQPNQIQGGTMGWTMASGIIGSIGSLSAGILNANDYARFARRSRDAVLGQAITVFLYGILRTLFGILVTAATQDRFGELWNLPTMFEALIQRGGSRTRTASFFVGAGLVIPQIGTFFSRSVDL